MCTNSNFSAFGVLLVFKKLTFFYFPKMQLSHMSKSMDLNSGSFPLDSNIFIPFSLMWPSLQCHRLVSVLASATIIVSLGLEVIYRVPVFFPQANTLAPFVTFQVPPTNSIACPSSSSCPQKSNSSSIQDYVKPFPVTKQIHWATISGRLPYLQHLRLNHQLNTPYQNYLQHNSIWFLGMEWYETKLLNPTPNHQVDCLLQEVMDRVPLLLQH